MLEWFAFILLAGVAILIARILFMKIGINKSMIYLPFVHLVFIGLLAMDVSRNFQDGQARMVWLPALIIDFPISMFLKVTTEIVGRYAQDRYYSNIVTAPIIHYGVFGTIQYMAVGAYIDRKYGKPA
jgi:hypothetical protein